MLHTLGNHIAMALKSIQKHRIPRLHTRKQPTSKNAGLKASRTNVLPLATILKLVKNAKTRGQRVVTTNGSFDILHTGHVSNLNFAKKQGDILIVGINSDSSVRRNKGPGRPLTPARERAEIIASLKPVDAVFMYEELTPVKWIKILKPHIHVKGADRTMAEIVEKEAVESVGGKVVRAPYLKNKSTTGIIAKIRRGRL